MFLSARSTNVVCALRGLEGESVAGVFVSDADSEKCEIVDGGIVGTECAQQFGEPDDGDAVVGFSVEEAEGASRVADKHVQRDV